MRLMNAQFSALWGTRIDSRTVQFGSLLLFRFCNEAVYAGKSFPPREAQMIVSSATRSVSHWL